MNTDAKKRHFTKRSRARLAVGLVTILALAACGADSADPITAAPVIVVEGGTDESASADAAPGSSSDDSTASASDDAAVDDATTDEEQATAFAECMRDEGIDFPDPTVNADGSVNLLGSGGPGGGAVDPDQPGFEGAVEVCQPLLEGASFLPTDDETSEIEDQLLAFAQCLREEGVDVSDPDFGDGFSPAAIREMFGDWDPNDPANAEVIAACQSAFTGGFGAES